MKDDVVRRFFFFFWHLQENQEGNRDYIKGGRRSPLNINRFKKKKKYSCVILPPRSAQYLTILLCLYLSYLSASNMQTNTLSSWQPQRGLVNVIRTNPTKQHLSLHNPPSRPSQVRNQKRPLRLEHQLEVTGSSGSISTLPF